MPIERGPATPSIVQQTVCINNFCTISSSGLNKKHQNNADSLQICFQEEQVGVPGRNRRCVKLNSIRQGRLFKYLKDYIYMLSYYVCNKCLYSFLYYCCLSMHRKEFKIIVCLGNVLIHLSKYILTY